MVEGRGEGGFASYRRPGVVSVWTRHYLHFDIGEPSILECAQDALDTSPAAGFVRIQQRGSGAFQVILQQDSNTVSAASMAANGIDPVSVAEHDFDRRGLIQDARPCSAEPISGLLRAWEIINTGCCRHHIHVPTVLRIQRNNVIAVSY